MLLDDRNRRVEELEAQTARQATTISTLESKLVEGETCRRKLHNQVLELKVRRWDPKNMRNKGREDGIYEG